MGKLDKTSRIEVAEKIREARKKVGYNLEWVRNWRKLPDILDIIEDIPVERWLLKIYINKPNLSKSVWMNAEKKNGETLDYSISVSQKTLLDSSDFPGRHRFGESVIKAEFGRFWKNGLGGREFGYRYSPATYDIPSEDIGRFVEFAANYLFDKLIGAYEQMR
jgi:hypothetical protein